MERSRYEHSRYSHLLLASSVVQFYRLHTAHRSARAGLEAFVLRGWALKTTGDGTAGTKSWLRDQSIMYVYTRQLYSTGLYRTIRRAVCSNACARPSEPVVYSRPTTASQQRHETARVSGARCWLCADSSFCFVPFDPPKCRARSGFRVPWLVDVQL